MRRGGEGGHKGQALRQGAPEGCWAYPAGEPRNAHLRVTPLPVHGELGYTYYSPLQRSRAAPGRCWASSTASGGWRGRVDPDHQIKPLHSETWMLAVGKTQR